MAGSFNFSSWVLDYRYENSHTGNLPAMKAVVQRVSRARVLVVNQFTLLGDTRKGNRPGFGQAAEPRLAEKLYEEVAAEPGAGGLTVETGRFGAMMDVELVNDGPMTIIVESPERPSADPAKAGK
ncbi:MAG: D-aminoacyl-tRNA deacylase [Actinomycetota bacterium]